MYKDLRTLADSLGIAEYPEALNAVYESIRKDALLSDITGTLEQLHRDYEPFDTYYDFLLRGAEAVLADEALLTWLTLGLAYCKDASEGEAIRFPLPALDETEARAAFPALLCALELPEAARRYRARGFDEAQIRKNLDNLGRNIRVHEITQGRVALSTGLYMWMVHYTKALIFDHMGFNFQVTKWKDEAILLRHRKSGEYAFLLLKGNFAADGRVVGIRGAEDAPALFEAAVEETEDAFIGYRAQGQRVRTERERFEKRDWEAVLRPGDDVIGFHIPRGADMTPEHVEASMAEAVVLMKRYYPEFDFKFIVCTTWMIDPKLLDVLPENSKIAHFIRHFVVHPSGDTAGNACMGYVWPGETCPTEELPEKTSLQRGIKKMMLEGSYIFWTTGIWR